MNTPASGPMKRGSVCLLASGGLDSSMLLADLLEQGRDVYPLFVRSGFYWEKAELHWLSRFLGALKGPRLKPLTVAEASMKWLMKGHWSLTGRGVPAAGSAWESVYLPGRNLVLLTQAGIFSAERGIPLLALAVLKGNPFADSKPSFFSKMEGALNAALGTGLRVLAPYARLSKLEVARRHAGYPFELTFSCLRPKGVSPCLRCNKCEERRQSLAGLKRPGLPSGRRQR